MPGATPPATPAAVSTPATPAAPAAAVVDAANAAADAMLDAGDDVLPPYPAELEAAEAAAEGADDATPADAADEAETPAEGDTVEGDSADAPAEGDDEPAEETPAAEADAAAPPAAPPAEDPKAIERRQQAETSRAAAEAAYVQWEKDFTALETTLAGEGELEFDALDKANGAKTGLKVVTQGMKILKAGLIDLAAQQASLAAERQVNGYWQDFGARNPDVGAERAQKIFSEEVQKAQQKYPNGEPAAIRLVASERWESRLAQIRAQKGKPAAGAKAPATPATPAKPAAAKPATPPPAKPRPQASKDGRVVPRSSTTRPPAPKPRTEEEEFAKAHRDFGSVSALLGDD